MGKKIRKGTKGKWRRRKSKRRGRRGWKVAEGREKKKENHKGKEREYNENAKRKRKKKNKTCRREDEKVTWLGKELKKTRGTEVENKEDKKKK